MALFVRFDKFLNIFIINLRKKYCYNVVIKQHPRHLISIEHNMLTNVTLIFSIKSNTSIYYLLQKLHNLLPTT